jgi:hypothetical protein
MTWSVFFIPGAMFLCTLFIERDVYPSNWPIVVFALIGNFTTTLCFAILYMYTGKLLTHQSVGFVVNLYCKIINYFLSI